MDSAARTAFHTNDREAYLRVVYTRGRCRAIARQGLLHGRATWRYTGRLSPNLAPPRESEATVKKWIVAVLAALTPTLFAQQSAIPEIPFDGNITFFKLPPDMNFGEASGVAINSKGDVAVYTRSNSAGGPAYGATASQILLFDKTGKFVREVGKGLYAWSYAHAIRFDKDDNLWAIDKGSDMIVRFNPEGHVTMVFGRKKEASDEAEPWTRVNPPRPPIPGQFRQPTDVAWDGDGNIYISDGYINARVAKFTKDGDWVASLGEPGGGKLGMLNTVHTIANEAKGNI